MADKVRDTVGRLGIVNMFFRLQIGLSQKVTRYKSADFHTPLNVY